MSGKIFPSRGVSSRPLTSFERLNGQVYLSLRQDHPNLMEVGLLAVIIAKLKHAWRRWRNRNKPTRADQQLQALVDALAVGSYDSREKIEAGLQAGQPLKIESLEATMDTVTFRPDWLRAEQACGETCSNPGCRCGCHF